jgi:hypothetical protein
VSQAFGSQWLLFPLTDKERPHKVATDLSVLPQLEHDGTDAVLTTTSRKLHNYQKRVDWQGGPHVEGVEAFAPAVQRRAEGRHPAPPPGRQGCPSGLCDEYKLQPGVFYNWQRLLFEK